MGTSGYIWLALLFKVPAIGFAWLVWRALRSDNKPSAEPQEASGDDGGAKLRLHPRPRVPRPPRRGPHGAAPIPPPRRLRSVNARGRVASH
jgi:hypothetical protein